MSMKKTTQTIRRSLCDYLRTIGVKEGDIITEREPSSIGDIIVIRTYPQVVSRFGQMIPRFWQGHPVLLTGR